MQSFRLKTKENHDKIKTKKRVDSYAAWNNDVGDGDLPRLIERSGGQLAEGPSAGGMGRLRDEREGRGEALEGTRRRGDSEQRESVISQEVFDTYLNDGIMKAVEETVAAEIGQYVNLDAMVDPVEKDKARDSLPHIKQMLAESNSRITQTKVYYKNRYATFLPFIERYNRKV